VRDAIVASNAHPHTDCVGDVVVAHNGIVENYEELREELRERSRVHERHGHRSHPSLD